MSTIENRLYLAEALIKNMADCPHCDSCQALCKTYLECVPLSVKLEKGDGISKGDGEDKSKPQVQQGDRKQA